MMKILIYEWETEVSTAKIMQAMEQHGWTVKKFYKAMKDYYTDEEFDKILPAFSFKKKKD